MRAWVWTVTAALILAGCGGGGGGTPSVDIKGSNPKGPVPRLAPGAVPTANGNGIITYDGYQAAVARQGDTVSSVAARVGMSASELGAYNGLGPTHPLLPGDELVLPSRPGGYGDVSSNSGGASGIGTSGLTPGQTGAVPTVPRTGAVTQAAPLAPLRPLPPETPPTATQPDTRVATLAPTPPQAAPARAGWSPDLAAAAIDRATGIDANGNLAAPPSTNAPLPPDQKGVPTLASPDLGQYQTPNPVQRPATAAQAARTQAAVADATATAALATTTPPGTATGKLTRPVDGPIAIGFNKGAGPSRNDGVDFAAPAGAPVVAAQDGEVALVSQSLGGLGTIVLVRHAGELLTVYGRIDGVTVAKGDIVKRGQRIGVVSNAAAPAEPRMHFEVRRGAESLDPTAFF